MPGYKRRARAPATRRPKRKVFRRKAVVPRYVRPREGMLNIKRKFHFGTWFPNTSTTNGFWRTMSISLQDVRNYGELTALFDQYKICAIKWTLIANFSAIDGNNANPPGTAIMNKPTVTICYDKYTTTSVSGTYSQATYNAFLEQGKTKIVKDPFAPIHIYVARPTVKTYDTINSIEQFKLSHFLRSDNYSTSHYGPQVFISDPNFAGTNFSQLAYDMICTVYIQCKNQK